MMYVVTGTLLLQVWTSNLEIEIGSLQQRALMPREKKYDLDMSEI
jgi:hypothetical protein